MEKDFHHHIVYALARISGFGKKPKKGQDEEAKIMAYASQYVDDNCDREYSISKDGIPYVFALPSVFKTVSGTFYPLLTQSVDIKSLDPRTQFYVFMPFHFLPGDAETVKIGGRSNPKCTTRNSANSNALLDAALKSKDPYRIGIALHTFADTWSHERFTAFNEPWNKVLNWYRDFKALAPDIGHADVWHLPDQICKTWRDHRFDEAPVVNKDRALEAVETIHKKLHQKGRGMPWREAGDAMEKILSMDGFGDSDERKIYDERKKLIEAFIGEPVAYDKDEWIEGAVDIDVDRFDPLSRDYPAPMNKVSPQSVRLKEGFEKSHWHRFQAAAKIHQAEALRMTASL
jgi:hypothetical protein